MKILGGSKVIAELSNAPKNLDCGCKRGVFSIVIGDDEIKIATYDTQERACQVKQEFCRAYLSDAEEFILPKE